MGAYFTKPQFWKLREEPKKLCWRCWANLEGNAIIKKTDGGKEMCIKCFYELYPLLHRKYTNNIR